MLHNYTTHLPEQQMRCIYMRSNWITYCEFHWIVNSRHNRDNFLAPIQFPGRKPMPSKGKRVANILNTVTYCTITVGLRNFRG